GPANRIRNLEPGKWKKSRRPISIKCFRHWKIIWMSEGKEMKCPACQGIGKRFSFGCPGFKPIEVNCDICGGSGKLPPDLDYDPKRGRNMRDERQAQDLSLREFCKKQGVSPAERSKMERGFFPKEEQAKEAERGSGSP